jgi:four helix bundle protein
LSIEHFELELEPELELELEKLPKPDARARAQWFAGRESDDGRLASAWQRSAMSDFRKLQVWQKAHALSIEGAMLARRIARKRRGLADQLSRAADAIPANIAEGRGSSTDVDFARYLTMAIKEANELENHVQRAADSELCSRNEYEALTGATIEVRKMLIGLRRRLLQGGRA